MQGATQTFAGGLGAAIAAHRAAAEAIGDAMNFEAAANRRENDCFERLCACPCGSLAEIRAKAAYLLDMSAAGDFLEALLRSLLDAKEA